MERYTDTISGEELYVNTVSNRTKFYYKDKAMTIYHRLDGPAIEGADGYKAWYVDNKLHRLDGPAVEWAGGDKAWWVDGERHRLDGPACEYADGGKAWWVDGRLHRLDGPAVERANGYKAWYVDGVFIMELDKHNKFLSRMGEERI